jgi:hypothetical protein
MWYLVYAGATVLFATFMLLGLGLLIFLLLNKYSKKLFGEVKYLDFAFAGAILIALSQLFSPLVATMYPAVFGLDASDYRLEFENTYIILSNNSSPNNQTIAETDYGDVIVYVNNNTFYNKITANNKNRYFKHNKKIFLEIIVSDGRDNIMASLTRPVIEIDQSSNLTIRFKDDPSPGLYRISVRGTDEDLTVRVAMMVIGIPENLGEDVIYFTPEAVAGSGFFMAYRFVNLSSIAHQQAYDRLVGGHEQGSGTIDNQYAF